MGIFAWLAGGLRWCLRSDRRQGNKSDSITPPFTYELGYPLEDLGASGESQVASGYLSIPFVRKDNPPCSANSTSITAIIWMRLTKTTSPRTKRSMWPRRH